VNKRIVLNRGKYLLAFGLAIGQFLGRNRAVLLNVGKYLLALGLLAWVVQKNWMPGSDKGLEYVWQRHVVQGQPIHTGFLLGGLLALVTAVLLTFVRWYVLVRAQGLPFRAADALRLGLLGFFFNNFLPSSVGGDVIKAAFLAREQSRRTVAVATVIMDRVIALWGLFWFVALLGGVFWLTGNLEGEGSYQSKWIVKVAAAVVGLSAVVWLLMGLLPAHRAERFARRLSWLPKVGGSAAEFWRAAWMYRCRQSSVALALFISWVGFVGFVLAYYCCVRTLWDADAGSTIPTLTQHFLLVPIGLVIGALPLFPGGAGIAEAGFGALYGWYGCSAASGVLGMLVQRVLTWGLGLLGYLAGGRLRTAPPADDIPGMKPPIGNGEAQEHRPYPTLSAR
jgi:uncharacterized protein (TIRG00374 family)